MFTRIPLPQSTSSGFLSEPIFRLEESLNSLEAGIGTAIYFNNATRSNRLQAFKANWVVKAGRVWSKLRDDTQGQDTNGEETAANAYSEQLRQEVIAALAVSD